MIREDGMMLAKLDNTKGKDGFRTEEWRDLYEHAAEHMLKHMKKRSIERGVERCRVTITKEELVELIKRSPCTPFFDADSPYYREFLWARSGVGETPRKLTYFTSCFSLSMDLSFRCFATL